MDIMQQILRNFNFDNDNENSRMFRDTNPIGRRKRSHNNDSGGRRQIVCYKCNKLVHIARNCKAPNNQNDGDQRKNVYVCQLCNKFAHEWKKGT